MRIRRYAARLLSAATAAPSSPPPPPPPAAPWFHATAEDCCAFCELSHPSPQEGPDAIKHKGHIAGRLPESEVRGDERVGLSQRQPAPEVQKCKTGHGPHVNKISVGQQAPKGASGVSGAAVKQKVAGGATLVAEADAETAAKPGPFIVNDATIEQKVNRKISLVSDATKPEVTGGNSLMNGSTTELEDHDQEVTQRVSPESKTVTVPRVTKVTGGDPGVTITMLRTCSLSTEGAARPEVTGAAFVMHETTKLESAREDYITSEAAAEPEDSGRTSCNVNDTAAFDKPHLLSCDPNIDTVQVENAGETIANALQPGSDAANVGGSVNSTSNGPVRANSPTVEGRVQNAQSVTPSVSCLFDIVARSIGTSGRTDVICYARRKGKRKLELLEVKTENIELEDGVICEENRTLERTGCCESVLSTAESADVKLADIKKELMDSSAASKVKKTKRNRFECNIDYCRMTFKTKAELSVHNKNMCTVKSCSRRFRSHRYLRRHQSLHNDDMPYKCPWDGCGMAFKWSWDQAEHFKVHVGVKPYKCTTPGCSKIYKFVSDFTRHRRRCKPQR